MAEFKVVNKLPEPYRICRDVLIMPQGFAYVTVTDDPSGRFKPNDPLGQRTTRILESPVFYEVDGVRYRGFHTKNTLYVTTEDIEDLRDMDRTFN